MEKIKVKLSFEEKKAILKEIFDSACNTDLGLASRKCVMQHWYQIRPGLRDKTETLFFGLREKDGALCAFDQLPHGTENDDYFHAFDNFPLMEIVPKENNAGFDIKMNDRKKSSQDVLDEIKIFQEIVFIYIDFSKKYQEYIKKRELPREN